MTCKECIHYCLCKDTVADENWSSDAPEEVRAMFSPKGCENFKNKADYKEVKHGEWIEDENSENPPVCSCCGNEAQHVSTFEETFDYNWEENLQPTGYEEHREYIKTPYCPHCGAKMDGKDINVPTNGRSDT